MADKVRELREELHRFGGGGGQRPSADGAPAGSSSQRLCLAFLVGLLAGAAAVQCAAPLSRRRAHPDHDPFFQAI